MSTTLGDLMTVLERRYPTSTAESWDQVGLVCGAPDWNVSTVLLTVDITQAVIEEAIETGADLIVAHHPLLLKGINAVDGRNPKGAMLLRLIRHRIGCYAAHTNADIPPEGVCVALAEAIGVTELEPLDGRRRDSFDQIVFFVPSDHTERVVDAVAAAGAGAIGDYERCHFRVSGTGSFRPLEGAQPFLGTVDEVETVAEDRVEVVLPRARRAAVVDALLEAHPYEEPAYHLLELAPVRPESGIGRVGVLPEPLTAEEFARRIAAALPPTATGVRLGGDPQRRVRRVGVLAGAGDSHLDAARKAGVDAYVTSDLRHHPATEALEWEYAPVLLDIAHWAAEWTWLPVLAEQLRAETEVEVHISRINTDAWTASYPSPSS